MKRKQRVPGASKFFDETSAYMKRENINQAELAIRMGVDQSTVSRMLNNKTSPSVETLDRLAAVMGREVMELLYWYLGRPLPDVYEMARRAYALGSHDYARLSEAASALFKEQEQAEPHNQSIQSKPRKNVR